MSDTHMGLVLRQIRKLAAGPADAPPSDGNLLERFVAHREETAFAELVRRHGPMVLGVCRSVLHNWHDAEDAFQATFLILARDAAAVRRGEALGGWLYRVAYHFATKVQARAARRRRHEARTTDGHAPDPEFDMTVRELRAVLHAELDRLPDKYRTPLVLCYLEGKTHEEAARQLGWSKGTVRGRLDRGREHLRRRLVRRGLGLAVGTATTALAATGASAALPAGLVQATVKIAMPAAGTVPAEVAALLQGVSRAMFASKLRFTALWCVLLLTAVGAAGVGLFALHARAGKPVHEAETPPAVPQKPAAPEAGDLVFSGRVFDPDGKPFAGAKLYLTAKSSLHKPLRLKDPTTKTHETRTVNGKTETRVVHPKLIAVLKRFGLDPDRPAGPEWDDNPKVREAFQEVMRELYEDHLFHWPTPRAVSGPDGRFRFTYPKAELKAPYHEDVDVLALAPGFGPGWWWSEKEDAFGDITVRLARDVPIEGRILSQEGKPVPGVTVRLGSIITGPDGTLKAWADLLAATASGDNQRHNELFAVLLKRQMIWTNLPLCPKQVTTDADGRFRITGIGAERLVFNVQINGPTIGRDQFSIAVRPGPWPQPPGREPIRQAAYRTYGARFDHIVGPTRQVVGTIRDRATSRPLAGVQVDAWGPGHAEAFSDKDGRYQLTGLAKSARYTITAWPYGGRQSSEPYLTTTIQASDRPGLEPLTVDFDLVRGVVLRGRVVAKDTGKGVGGAMVHYAAFHDNPHAAAFAFPGNPKFGAGPEFLDAPLLQQTHTTSGPDGSFRLVMLPGRGLVGVRVPDGPYTMARLEEAEKDAYFWSKVTPHVGTTDQFQAIKILDVPDKAAEFQADVIVDPGQALKGAIVGADGRSLTGVSVTGLNVQAFRSTEPLSAAEFTVAGLSPNRPRLVTFLHKGKNLGAVLLVRPEDKGPLTVRLEPCGTVTGRLLDKAGKPLAAAGLWAYLSDGRFQGAEGHAHMPGTATDKEGRFRLEGLVPGVSYAVNLRLGAAASQSLTGGMKLEAGQTKELGDLVVRVRQAP
jgi:RNA polymerase sigma factor (sigma-70 family)